jgi:FdhD protein
VHRLKQGRRGFGDPRHVAGKNQREVRGDSEGSEVLHPRGNCGRRAGKHRSLANHGYGGAGCRNRDLFSIPHDDHVPGRRRDSGQSALEQRPLAPAKPGLWGAIEPRTPAPGEHYRVDDHPASLCSERPECCDEGMQRIAIRRRVTRVSLEAGARQSEDMLAAEEPLEIRVGGTSLAITMRTPGHDFDLAAGFLVSEGVVATADHFAAARYCAGATDEGLNTYNVLDVTLGRGVAAPDPSLERNFYTTSSCGLCGKASIDAVRTHSHWTVLEDDLVVRAELLTTLPDRLREGQDVFEKTGGLHAAALFDGRTGELLVLREDVGRHNAVDKVIGWALVQGLLPLRGTVLMVSGRSSFELTQKALMAGIPMLAAVSAPSSLAAELANEVGITLIGFLRGTSMVVYSRPERVDPTIRDAVASDALHQEKVAL